MPGRLRAAATSPCRSGALAATLVLLVTLGATGDLGAPVLGAPPRAAVALDSNQLLSAHLQPQAASSTGATSTASTQVTVASTIPKPVPSTAPPGSTSPTTLRTTATTAPTPPRTTQRTTPRTVAPYYPPATAGQGSYAPPSASPTSAAPTTTSTTIAPIGGQLPAAPATLPLALKGSSAHVSPVFAILSGVGFLVALLIAGARFFVTRGGGSDRRPMVD